MTVKRHSSGEITVTIDPVFADILCRRALKAHAVRCGLDDKKNFSVINWHWHLGNKRRGVVFNGEQSNGF